MELIDRVRRACFDLPEVTERPSHSAPTFFVKDKKSFVMVWAEGHHHNQFPHLWCAAPPGVQAEVVETEPDRFFVPPYVGGRGWLGVRLDVDLDDQELAALCEEAYRVVAPVTLVKQLDARAG